MRRLRYGVATSLDGFIAGPNGEYDWIVYDPAIDFAAMFAQYDTLLMGRKTYEVASEKGKSWDSFGQRWIVVSTTLKPEEHPAITILSSGVQEAVAALKAQPGKDIWLFGGGVLFRNMLDAGLVDTVEVGLMPVMLGSGVPLLPEGKRRSLHLEESKALPSGILMLKYSVAPARPRE
ncbi:MAG: dihydrofolate reductase family protein [Terracidiphilus sp.]|jgi:dihydrofolate reductase